MEYLIFSDSHGDAETMAEIAEKRKPKGIIFLGDCIRDIEKVVSQFPSAEYRIIKGNNDFYNNYPCEDTLFLGGKKIFLCHGHTKRVKMGTYYLADYCREKEFDIALFGHTHKPLCEYVNGVLLFNPGSVGYERTYGILTIEKGKVDVLVQRF